MPRVVFDTNILVSALNYRGIPARLLALAEEGVFRLQLSTEILNETARVPQDKFDWSENAIEQAIRLLSSISQHVVPHLELDVVKRDPSDNRILECAQASQSDYIVTGDKDLLDLKQYAGAQILTPAEFLRLFPRRTQ